MKTNKTRGIRFNMFSERLEGSVLSMALVGVLVMALGQIAGCGQSVRRPPQSNDPVKMTVKGKSLIAEVVFDDAGRRRGLMDRETMEWNKGMLFLYPIKKIQSFWMKDTLIPLSIAFIDEEGTIRQIRDMRPKDLSSVKSKDEVPYALEMNKGWFEKEGVGVGDRIDGFKDLVARFPVK